jgi:tetratricopeptide (TPR) repeat protein
MSRAWTLAVALLAVVGTAAADWDEGVAAYNRGDYSVAADHFTQALRKHPDYAVAHFMLGLCNVGLDQTGEAVTHLARAVELAPEKPRYTLELGRAFLTDGQPDRAWTTLEALDVSDVEPAIRTSHALTSARTALRRKRPQDAVPVLEAAISDAGDNSNLYKALGVAHHRLDRDRDAVIAWGRAFELDPEDVESATTGVQVGLDAAEDCANEEERAGLLELAVDLATHLAETSARVEHLAFAGSTCLEAGKLDQAVNWFELAHGADPSNAATLLQLGRTLGMSGQMDAADARLQAALALEPVEDVARSIHALRARFAECRLDLRAAVKHHRLAGESERAVEIEELASSFGNALSQREELHDTIAGLRRMLPQLEELGDQPGQEAVRGKITGLEQELAGIDANLAEVRSALQQSCP